MYLKLQHFSIKIPNKCVFLYFLSNYFIYTGCKHIRLQILTHFLTDSNGFYIIYFITSKQYLPIYLINANFCYFQDATVECSTVAAFGPVAQYYQRRRRALVRTPLCGIYRKQPLCALHG